MAHDITMDSSKHISEQIRASINVGRILRPRQLTVRPPRQQVHDHLRRIGFLNVSHICNIEINWPLISALVERWRPETHTFHFPVGECTVTLEDVALLIGLPIHGLPVIGTTNPSRTTLRDLCEELLGGVPGENDVVAGEISILWITFILNSIVLNSDEAITRYIRGYILCLLGRCILPSKSTDLVHVKYIGLLRHLNEIGNYSWGSACLAMLYRGLDRATRIETHEIAGCIILLQLWAWQRLPMIAPLPGIMYDFPVAHRWTQARHPANYQFRVLENIRVALDQLQTNMFTWQPYEDPMIKMLIPPEVQQERIEWLTIRPLLCFEVVEWHAADRVMRQFGLAQMIPANPRRLGRSHNLDLRGRGNIIDWRAVHEQWVNMWLSREDIMLEGWVIDNYNPTGDYMNWYTEFAANWLHLTPGQQAQPQQPLLLIDYGQQPQQQQPQQQQVYMEDETHPQRQQHHMDEQAQPQQQHIHMEQVQVPEVITAQSNAELYWDSTNNTWRPFNWDQMMQSPCQQPHGVGPSQPRESRSHGSSSGIVRGIFSDLDFSAIDTAQSSHQRGLDLNLSMSVNDIVYRPDMTGIQHPNDGNADVGDINREIRRGDPDGPLRGNIHEPDRWSPSPIVRGRWRGK